MLERDGLACSALLAVLELMIEAWPSWPLDSWGAIGGAAWDASCRSLPLSGAVLRLIWLCKYQLHHQHAHIVPLVLPCQNGGTKHAPFCDA